jgi:hypothetical protein
MFGNMSTSQNICSCLIKLLHLNQASQILVVIGPFGFCWQIQNNYICQNNSKWQNGYICLNSHNIIYLILIIIYYCVKFLLILCLNSHYGFVQDCSRLAIILFEFCINNFYFFCDFILWTNIHLHTSIELQFNLKNRILVFHSIFDLSFFCCCNVSWYCGPIIQ